jgi:hypothetical protein
MNAEAKQIKDRVTCFTVMVIPSYLLACVIDNKSIFVGTIQGRRDCSKFPIREIIALHFVAEILGAYSHTPGEFRLADVSAFDK